MARMITAELEKPLDADLEEWEAFVSWYNEDCDDGFMALQRIWLKRVAFGFDKDLWLRYRQMVKDANDGKA